MIWAIDGIGLAKTMFVKFSEVFHPPGKHGDQPQESVANRKEIRLWKPRFEIGAISLNTPSISN
jgi:hypothetical protein